jgi:hypothetical protein
MRKIKFLALALLAGSLLFACEKDKVDVQKYLEFSMPELFSGPFSTLTREQKKTRKKFVEVFTTNFYLDTLNLKAGFAISREDFLLEGLPESYYLDIIQACKDINRLISTDTVFGPLILKEYPMQMAQLREENAKMVID